MRVRLTQHLIDNDLAVPQGRDRVELLDDQTKNFFIEVRSSSPGKGKYRVRYRDKAGDTRYMQVGCTTEISLADARAKAKEIKASIALGADPRAEAKAQKKVLTFDAFFENHYLPYVKPRKRSWRRDEELYRLRIKEKFGNRRLNQISRQQIQMFHTEVLASGLAPGTADHHLRFLKHAFNLAIDWGLLDREKSSCTDSALRRR